MNEHHPLIYSIAKHLIGFVVVVGLFGVIGIGLLGAVNIENPTVALLIGQVLGLVMTPVLAVVTDYFPRGKVEHFHGKANE